MNGIRLAIVTHRFWPLAGASVQVVGNLARELLQQGVLPSIVTARLDSRWPSDVVFREMPVHRLPCSQRLGGTMRYMIGLSRWLRRNLPDFDAVCVSRLAHDAHATLGALAGTGVPILVRAEADEVLGPQRTARSARLTARLVRRCQAGAALIATEPKARDMLIRDGFEPHRIELIPDGVATMAACTFERRMESRAALAAVNDDLRVGYNMPVVSFIGPFLPEFQLGDLVAAWKHVARRWPDGRLWLIGDGGQRERLYRRIRDLDLYGRVLMPGTFDCYEDVICSSNLVIVSARMAGSSPALLEAMAMGVPVLVIHATPGDNLVRDGVTGRVLREAGVKELADLMAEVLANPQPADRMAEAAREFVQHSRSLTEMARRHREVLHNLLNSSVRSVP